jgi:uncharacterized membrane protein HdeD (DUF308 family)
VSTVRRLSSRWSALPALLERAPARVLLLAGLVLVVLGALIAMRPLTSIVVLGVYVGLSAVVTGATELASAHRSPRWWTRVFAALWIAGGVAVLVFLGRSLDLLPTALAALLVLGGMASLGDAVAGGRASERVLAGAWGVAQIALGILSRSWPDVTILMVAAVFGVRTVAFGVSLVVRGARGMRRTRAPRRRAVPAARGWLAAGRYALALVLVATAGSGWAIADWLQDGAPVVDAFYDPPAELPAGPGELIRSEPYLGQAPEGGVTTRILYTTRDARDNPAVASALVITPAVLPAGPRPVVSWNHGTTGVAQGCAPSLRDSAATRFAIPAVESALAAGWVVVASDYSGQGAPGVFPYLIGAGEAHSSLDAVLAADQLEGLRLSPDTVIWGHSQGGHAALWSARLAPEYAPGLNVLGTVAVAPAADPAALADALLRDRNDAVFSVLAAWVLVPYADTYPDVDLQDYIAPGSRSLVREMTQRCPSEPGVIVSFLSALGVSEDRPLYTGDVTSGALGRRLAENSAATALPTPLMVVWGDEDEVIPVRVQRDFVRGMCEQGQALRWIELEGEDHIGPVWPGRPVIPAMFRWSQGLVERTPVQKDRCADVPASW